MSYERGLSRLSAQVRKARDGEAAKQVAKLEVRLRAYLRSCVSNAGNPNLPREFECIVNDLNKIACRAVGTSYVSLCAHRRSGFSGAIAFLSLRGVLLLVIIGLLLPVLGLVLAATGINADNQWQIEQVRRRIQAIDNRIGDSVKSPFYLSYIPPCSDAALNAVRTTNDLILTRSSSSSDCVWEYIDTDTGQVMAKDYWDWDLYPVLDRREYFEGDSVIAQDSFDSRLEDCFRQRQFFDSQARVRLEECFNEAGVRRSVLPADGPRSPIPPMLSVTQVGSPEKSSS